MNTKNAVKKIAAVLAGTAMLGATVMGAMAIDLSNYPQPFINDGIFSGKIIVGATAATQDVVGAIDIAASLQRMSVSTTDVKLPGTTIGASITGDVKEFKTGSNVLSIGENIGSVKATFTGNDVTFLEPSELETSGSTTPVKQYLKFGASGAHVVYEEDTDNNTLSDFLKIPTDSTVFDYQIEFTKGAESEIDGTNLPDLEGEVVSILGAPFTIVDGYINGNQVTLTLLGGQVSDSLKNSETKTYTINGKDYEVTAVFIGENGKAKLSVNGVVTKELSSGKTQVLGKDLTIGVQSVLTNNQGGIVDFYLGANKIKFTDSDFTDNTFGTGSVEVGGKTINNADLIIKGSTSGNTFKLNYIKYRLTSDSDYYVPANTGVRAQIEKDNKGAMLTNMWDIVYTGLTKSVTSDIKLKSIGDYAYSLEFNNVNGDNVDVPFATNKDSHFRMGNKDDDFITTESNLGSPWSDAGTFISKNDYFVVSDSASPLNDEAVTTVLRYQSINTGDSTVTFKDFGSGEDLIVSYTGTPGTDATGDLIVNGQSHTFYVGHSSSGEENYALSIDLNGDGTITNGAVVPMVASGGAILKTLVNGAPQVFDVSGPVELTSGDDVLLQLITKGNKIDGTPADEITNITITDQSSGKINVANVVLGGMGQLVQDPSNDNYERGYTSYGAFFELYNPTSGNNADELTVAYPSDQQYSQVYIVSGDIKYTNSTITPGATYTSKDVHPINVGLAALDSAGSSGRMIVVGGPCVNKVAADLMGATPATCATGFTEGKAVIKLYADKNAVLVAGYSAQDTLAASYVLAQPDKYKLSGTEVEIITSDLNNLKVNVIQ